jgi:hypothetical protein
MPIVIMKSWKSGVSGGICWGRGLTNADESPKAVAFGSRSAGGH